MSETFGEKMVAWARNRLKSPYLRGENGPDRFDCVGLVRWCAEQAGYGNQAMSLGGSTAPDVDEYHCIQAEAQNVNLRRVSGARNLWYYDVNKFFSDSSLQTGDIVFMKGGMLLPDVVTHCGIYDTGGIIIHATEFETYNVREDNIFNADGWPKGSVIGYGRLRC